MMRWSCWGWKNVHRFEIQPPWLKPSLSEPSSFITLSVQAFEANKGLIDIFWFANDFGTRKGLFIDPRMWRRFLSPSSSSRRPGPPALSAWPCTPAVTSPVLSGFDGDRH
jgi:hypothetical protein